MVNTFKNCTVISAMPAMGKSYFAAKFPIAFRDLESSEYHWTKDEDGNKIEHPDWPKNYIDAIKNLSKSGMYKAIFVSSHELIRQEMAKAKIRYANLCPVNNDDMRHIILARCIERKSPAKFITDLNDNWSDYINSMINDKGAAVVVQVDKNSLTEWANWAAMY